MLVRVRPNSHGFYLLHDKNVKLVPHSIFLLAFGIKCFIILILIKLHIQIVSYFFENITKMQ